jgi:glycosyltransferase involved in cell wall biosynthesis
MNHCLYLVVPCFNEEKCLPITEPILLSTLKGLIAKGEIDNTSRLLLVDDGSKDKTWDLIESFHAKDPLVSGVKLSRNKGHQYALFAGLSIAVSQCDATISIDADLQDDVSAIEKMVGEWKKGSDVVYGVRESRKSDSFFKRFSAEAFYKILAKMGVEVVYNHADFRLLSKRALSGLLQYQETNLFLRGIIPQLGYPSSKVYYSRKAREAGYSHYPLSKMLALAWNGITSNSDKPLRWLTSFGLLLTVLSSLTMIVYGICYGVGVIPFSYMPFIFGSIFLMGGLLFIGLGLLGEYIGKINMEVKKRPRFFIEEVLK